LRVLDISSTPIKSLRTLAPQPILQEIIAIGSTLEDYGGLPRQPHLKTISFQSTPLSDHENFRLSCLVLVGPHLSMINGDPVTKSERNAAIEYPLIAKSLIESGWEIECPVPPKEKFKELANDFQLKLRGVDPGFTSEEARRYLRPPPAIGARREPPEPESEPQDDELILGIRATLRTIGVHVKPEGSEVLRAVAKLADILNELGNLSTLSDILAACGADLGDKWPNTASGAEEDEFYDE
jgi:hypothetical protein